MQPATTLRTGNFDRKLSLGRHSLSPFSQNKMGCAIGPWYRPYFRIDRSVLMPQAHSRLYARRTYLRSGIIGESNVCCGLLRSAWLELRVVNPDGYAIETDFPRDSGPPRSFEGAAAKVLPFRMMCL